MKIIQTDSSLTDAQPMTRAQFLKSMRSLMLYYRSCGIDCYPATEQLDSGLQALDAFFDREPPGKSSQITPLPRGVDELAREIVACQNCSLHETRKISTPGRGGSKPRLLIVGDWLVHDPRPQENALFGRDQDHMLSNMIKAIECGPDDVFITNIIKCSVERSYRGQSDHLAACISYLKQQISLLLPQVICTMGTVASQALLDTSTSLIGLRGAFHYYVLADSTRIPVMPTFHPTYLLKNPEMKKPTWGDLQAVRKRLDSMKEW